MLEENPGRFVSKSSGKSEPESSVAINLDRPMEEILSELSQYPVATPLSISGTIVVARDIAHEAEGTSGPRRRIA